MSDLKNELRQRLAGSSSQQPVDTATLAQGHQRRRVEAALMELYQANEVYCCKLTQGGCERVVWWLIGMASAPHSFGRNLPKGAA